MSALEQNRRMAEATLTNYLNTAGEMEIFAHQARAHQPTTLLKIRDSLANGDTAGNLKLPTGTGKTVIAAGLIKALDMNTVFVSPTGTILDQTGRTIQRFVPQMHVTNYDGRLKDLAGNVINTTPPSLERLAEIPPVAEGAQLIIADEVHLGALGEKRHKLWRKFPNALMLGMTATPGSSQSQLDNLISRGLVDPNEPWVKMFTNRIHSMNLVEAIDRGALVKPDNYLVETDIAVDNVHITAGGNYNEREIDKFLNKEKRDVLAIAMLGGLDKVPPGITLDPKLRSQIADIHEKIKGKRTAIFGLSIKHVEKLAEKMRDLGLKAAAVHGDMPPAKRELLLKAHENGKLPILLAVDMLRVGWDCPPTEVGLFMDVTQSPAVLEQEYGRILRLSEETGKKKAIAIQLVDKYANSSQRPVLISDLYDPNYIPKETQVKEPKKAEGKKVKAPRKEDPEIEVKGMSIKGDVEKRDETILQKLEFANIQDITEILNDVVNSVKHPHIDRSIYKTYRRIAEALPGKMKLKTQKVAMEAAQSTDPKLQKQGKEAFTLLNLKTILKVVEPYLSKQNVDNDELIQIALTAFMEKFDEIKLPSTDDDGNEEKSHFNAKINQIVASGGVVDFVAEKEHMPKQWVKDKKHKEVRAHADEFFAENPYGLDENRLDEAAQVIAIRTSYNAKALRVYLEHRNSLLQTPDDLVVSDETVIFEPARRASLPGLLNEIFDESLSEREAGVVRLRFGLGEFDEINLDDTGNVYGISRERVRQIETKTLGKLRHPSRAKKLYDYREDV